MTASHQNFDYIDFFNGFPSSLVETPFFRLLEKIHEQNPDIPESILIGSTLSCLSFPLLYLSKIYTHNKSPFPFPAGVFFVGEMESDSGKTLLLKTFTEIFNKINKHNRRILPFFSNTTTTGIRKKLQSKKSSFFGLIGSDHTLIDTIFFSNQKKGIPADVSLFKNGWDGGIESVAFESYEFDSRHLACMICVFTQKGVIQEIFEKSDSDNLGSRFLFSSEPLKQFNSKSKTKEKIIIKHYLKTYMDHVFDYVDFWNEGKNLSIENDYKNLIPVFPSDDHETQEFIDEIKKEENRKNEACNRVGDFSTTSFYGKSLLHILKIANIIHFFNLSFSDQKEFQQKQILDLETIKAAQYLFSRFGLVLEKM